jgi:hypothetical protein
VFPLTLAATTQARVTARGQVVLPLSLGLTTLGRLGARSSVVLPLTLDYIVDGFVAGDVFGSTSLALTFDAETNGGFRIYGASDLDLLLLLTTGGFNHGAVITGHIIGASHGVIDGHALGHIEGTEGGGFPHTGKAGRVEEPLTGAIA